MSPDLVRKLVLVAPAGIRPPSGEIFDMFLVVPRDYIVAGFLDPEATPEFGEVCPEEPSAELNEAWAVAREEACRLSWRPYMHNLAMPNLVRRLKRVPTQIIWGREDNIVPVSAGPGLPRFHPRISARHPGRMRPSPRTGEDRRIP